MRIERVVPNLTVEDPEASIAQHQAVLGMEVVMHHGWIATLADADSNLFGRTPYPDQGIWLMCADEYSGERSAWSAPVRVVDPATDTDGWYAGGMCSPTLQWDEHDPSLLHLFFVTATARENWALASVRRLLRGRAPYAPSPFHFAIGRAAVRVHR